MLGGRAAGGAWNESQATARCRILSGGEAAGARARARRACPAPAEGRRARSAPMRARLRAGRAPCGRAQEHTPTVSLPPRPPPLNARFSHGACLGVELPRGLLPQNPAEGTPALQEACAAPPPRHGRLDACARPSTAAAARARPRASAAALMPAAAPGSSCRLARARLLVPGGGGGARAAATIPPCAAPPSAAGYLETTARLRRLDADAGVCEPAPRPLLPRARAHLSFFAPPGGAIDRARRGPVVGRRRRHVPRLRRGPTTPKRAWAPSSTSRGWPPAASAPPRTPAAAAAVFAPAVVAARRRRRTTAAAAPGAARLRRRLRLLDALGGGARSRTPRCRARTACVGAPARCCASTAPRRRARTRRAWAARALPPRADYDAARGSGAAPMAAGRARAGAPRADGGPPPPRARRAAPRARRGCGNAAAAPLLRRAPAGEGASRGGGLGAA